MKLNSRSVGFVSALIYTGISLVISGTFLGVTLARHYNLVTSAGGAAWIFILSMIILMPLVTPMVKKRLG